MAKMERPHNILNSAPDADRRLNTNIKGLVFWWSGITLFYLGSGLKIDEQVDLLVISLDGLTKPKFLFGLLILNVVFLVRLLWRIHISCRYNKFYDEAVREIVNKGGYAEEYIQTPYEEKMRCFNSREKWKIGLGIPIGMGFIAIAALIYHLIFPCLLWLKMCFGFEVSTFIFWLIATAIFWPVVLVIMFFVLRCVFKKLQCEYCRETELQCFLGCKRNLQQKNNRETPS